jgi:mannose-6-phosphate isomerase-like protein (cupin superfamily)
MTTDQQSRTDNFNLITVQQPRVVTNKVIKDRVTFLQRTDGKGLPTILEIELAPEGGNPPHIHTSYAETFMCLEGTLGINLAGESQFLQPGDKTTVPIGTVHNFFNPTEEVTTFRVELTPGHQGFERSMIIAYGLANDDLTNANAIPRNILYTALLLDMGGMTFPGGMRLLMPAFRLLANVARKQGVEKRLLEHYDA